MAASLKRLSLRGRKAEAISHLMNRLLFVRRGIASARRASQ
jgi:hypothetical protein